MIKNISNLGVFAFAALLILSFSFSGCASRTSRYIRVQSRIIETTRDNPEAEITATPRYSKIASQIKSVALSAPSSCADNPASSATGAAMSRGEIVKTNCGVEMAEIERELVRQEFTVYSWDMLNKSLSTNRSENAHAIVKKLGAQVLFQVNSLERVNMSPGHDARIEHSFFSSNASGDILEKLDLTEDQRNKINDLIKIDDKNRLSSTKKLGAMIDINAVDSETGQSIWFYRWSKHEDASKNVFTSYLLQCWDNWGPWCMILDEPGKDNQQTESGKSSTDVKKISSDPRPASEQDVIYYGLLREVTADFGKRFSSGR